MKIKNIEHYEGTSLLEILKTCLNEPRLHQYILCVDTEILRRFNAFDHNTKIFSKFGVTSETNKTFKDFKREYL